METLMTVLVVAAMFPCVNEAQTARHSRQQSANSDQTKLESQRRYDPLAGQKHLQDGPLDKFLDSINPRDRDFGALIAEAREHLVDQTAANSYFWITLGQSLTILLQVSYIFWLFRQRNDRLEISVNIVTQLANSYLYTRSRAVDAIRRHNQLVDNYNVMAEKQTKQNFAEQAAATSVVRASAGEQATEIPTQGESPLPKPELTSNSKSNSAEQMTTQDAPPDQVKMTKQQYKALIEETKRNATRGSAQQVAALNQQVRNLREQLNMALTRIEKYEKQNRSSVRA